MPKARGGNSSEGDSASLEWHYAVRDGLSSFVSTHLHQSHGRCPRRGATAGTKGHVLLRVLSEVADLAPHIMRWPAQSPSVSINGGSKAPIPQCELLLFI